MGCKAGLIIEALFQKIGFTLTMWDVKQALFRENQPNVLLFYLNYVGCKVSIITLENAVPPVLP